MADTTYNVAPEDGEFRSGRQGRPEAFKRLPNGGEFRTTGAADGDDNLVHECRGVGRADCNGNGRGISPPNRRWVPGALPGALSGQGDTLALLNAYANGIHYLRYL